ncbi:MAG: oligosaccharide flippase family protein [Desulfobulbus sp.]|nr:oligosaccharide flippase family protein [Desulfobulbus sp.]
MTTGLQSLPGKINRLAASSLVQNVGALAGMQAMGYLITLLTLPYLTRVLGPEEWGRVVWMQVILGYFTILSDWGFSWSGTRKIATLRNDHAALSESFFAGWAVQWGLSVVALGTLLGLSAFAPIFEQFRSYTFYGMGVIVAGVLFPAWLLSGLERIREVAIVQLAIRAGAVPLIFFFVRAPGDGAFVIAISALTGLIAGAAMLFWMWKNLSLDWHWPRWAQMFVEFQENGTIFLSHVWIVLYTSLIPTILGAMAGAVAVGQYVLADRIRMTVQSLIAPLAQALFPRMSYLFAHDRPAALRLLWHSGRLVVLISLAASLALFLLAEPILLLVAGPEFLDAAALLRWLSPLPLVVALSNLLGVQIMLAQGMMTEVNRVVTAGGVTSLIMITPLITCAGANGAAINTLIMECIVTFGFIVSVLKSRKWGLQ